MIKLWRTSIRKDCITHFSKDEMKDLRAIFFSESLKDFGNTDKLRDDINAVFKSIENDINFLHLNLSKFLSINKSVDGVDKDFDLLYEEKLKKQEERELEIQKTDLKWSILNSDQMVISNFYDEAVSK